jgi:hypothetical protein
MNRNRTKRRLKSFRMNALAASFSIGCAAVLAANAEPAAQPDKTEPPRSVFTIPSDSKEGRDPFFPDSTRPYEALAAANPKVADVSSLVLKGFSGSLDHRLVIINNHTFAAGDEGDVTTSAGRMHLTCIEIKTKSVVIEVGGQRHELFYSNQP